METIEIKNIYGDVIFSHTAENNTVKLTIETAVASGVSLAWANLANADLIGADLEGANIYGAKLAGAKLAWANLANADLAWANLAWANLEGAELDMAKLYETNLREANLSMASLYRANLEGAELAGANLSDADLYRANLTRANLSDANLYNTNLKKSTLDTANLNGAKNIPYIPLSCPSEGAFVAWKKVEGKYLVKLQIPEDARRLSATTRKCRCDKAMVLDITSLDGEKHYDEVTNTNYKKTVYKAGEMVYPDSFDENRWDECSHGIHFFVNKEDAIKY